MTNKRRSGLSYGVAFILIILAFIAGAGAGVAGWIYVTGGSGEASRTVDQAIAEAENNNDATNTETTNETTSETDATDETASDAMTFSIVAEQSEASFTLEEDLRGVRTTVIGTTREVGGNITVNMANPSASSVGTIAINARTIATDNDFRNRAIRGEILKSAQDEFEFIIFEPTSLSNFSADSVAVGDTITFDITGDLTVTGVTQSVTFNASVTVDSETQISGTATANVLYADFGLSIPNVASVANVTNDVDLAINFVAVQSTES